MSRNFIDIEDIPKGYENRVKQNLSFKTGKFVWRCRFTTALDPQSINSENLYVESEAGQRVQTKFSYNDSTMEIELEPLEPYSKDVNYYLHITTKVRSRGGQHLKEPLRVRFRL